MVSEVDHVDPMTVLDGLMADLTRTVRGDFVPTADAGMIANMRERELLSKLVSGHKISSFSLRTWDQADNATLQRVWELVGTGAANVVNYIVTPDLANSGHLVYILLRVPIRRLKEGEQS